MNRRTFFESLATAVGSLPLLGALVPKEDRIERWSQNAPLDKHANFQLTMGGIDPAGRDGEYTACIIGIAGEHIDYGNAVTIGKDGKLYRADTGRIDSEGNVRREALELERLCHENRLVTHKITVADPTAPPMPPDEYARRIVEYCRGK